MTLDYGPYGFLDAYDPDFICNHTDESGRYALSNQPGIGLWNLRALAVALTGLIDSEKLAARAAISYEFHFVTRYRELMRAKLGLVTRREEGDDDADQRSSSGMMAQARADYTLTFRGLGFDPVETGLPCSAQARADALPPGAHAISTRMAGEGDQSVTMNGVNPKYVLRNWVAEVAIRAVEDSNDAGPLDRILRLGAEPL